MFKLSTIFGLSDRIDLRQVLFHGLAYSFYGSPSLYDHTFKRFDKILGSSAILSRKKQAESFGQTFDNINIDDGGTAEPFAPNWNGEDFISICMKLENGLDGPHGDNPFEYYVQNGVSIILSKDILKRLTIRAGRHETMTGEIQIFDKIPSEYFIGVGVGLHFLKKTSVIADIISKNNCKLTMYSVENGKEIKG